MQQPRGSASSRSLAQSWLALPAKTRLYISFGVFLVGAAGIVISDRLEKNYPAEIKVQEERK